MTADEIARLRALCDKATPGPWQNYDPGVTGIIEMRGASTWDGCDHHLFCKSVDGEFIAAARTALPALLDEVERLQGEIEELENLSVSIGSMEECDKLRAENASLKEQMTRLALATQNEGGNG